MDNINVFDMISEDYGTVSMNNMEVPRDCPMAEDGGTFEGLDDNLGLLSPESIDNFINSDINWETLLNESGSDSGLSNNDNNMMMSPPSSGLISPYPRGDVSVDTLDAQSDVSSTSDLGSSCSFGSSPVRSNSRIASVSIDSVLDEPSDEVKVETFMEPIYFTEQSCSSQTKLNVRKLSSSTPRHIVTQSFTFPSQTQPTSSYSNMNIKLENIKSELPNGPKIVSIKPLANTKFPILKRLQLDPSKRTNQAIVVTRKANSTLQLANGKTKTLLKPIIFPSGALNVNEFLNKHNMQKVTIINPANKNESRTIVTSVMQPQITTATLSGSRGTVFTTKTVEARNHLKVTPTSLNTTTFSFKEEEASSSDEETPQQGQRLILSDEEKRLMRKESITLPSRYPLTKQQERDLKRIRRKIRNKKSAQDSRKRKKEYVDNLEDRAKLDANKIKQLEKKINSLEKQNETMNLQLKRVQNIMGYNLNRSHNHSSTALMMLILSAALIVVPSLRPQEGKNDNQLTSNAKMPNSGHSRTLLETDSSSIAFNGASSLELFDEDEVMDTDPLQGPPSEIEYGPSPKKIRMDPPLVVPKFTDGSGDPPDHEQKGVYALLGAMLHRLGTNWTDPGGSGSPSWGGTQSRPDSSVVVNLNRTMRDDIEVE